MSAQQVDFWREDEALARFSATETQVELPSSGARVTAPRVTGHTLRGELKGEGGVHLEGRDGTQATTPYVQFERSQGEQGTVFSDGGLELTQPGFHLSADAFVLDVAQEHGRFENVKTTFTAQ